MEELEGYITKRKINILMENQKNVYNRYYDKNLHEGKSEVIYLINEMAKKHKTAVEMKSFLNGLIEESTEMINELEKKKTY